MIGEEELLYQALYRRRGRRSTASASSIPPASSPASSPTPTSSALQAHSPHQLVLDIEGGLDDLQTLHARIQALVTHLSGTGIPIRDLVRLIAHLNDQIVVRLIGLLRAEWFDDIGENSPPSSCSAAKGAETDPGHRPGQRHRLCRRPVPGTGQAHRGILARADRRTHRHRRPGLQGRHHNQNADWRRSLGDWQKQLARWMGTPTPTTSSPAAPSSTCALPYGSPRFEGAQGADHDQSDSNNLFLLRMVEGGLRFTPPIGWFRQDQGRERRRTSGRTRDQKTGIFAITDGIKALAVPEQDAQQRSTLQRLETRAPPALSTNATAPRSTKASASSC